MEQEEVIRRREVLKDVFYCMVGLDGLHVAVRRYEGPEMEISVSNALTPDEARIVDALRDIFLAVREIKYKIEDAYYTQDYIKQALLKGTEEEIDAFANRVAAKNTQASEMAIEALPFIFQDEIALFRCIRHILRSLGGVQGLFFLQLVMDASIPSGIPHVLSAVISPTNESLKAVIRGETRIECFRERKTYDYDGCFWTRHFVAQPAPKYLQMHLDRILTLSKISKVVSLYFQSQPDTRESGDADAVVDVPDLLKQKGNQVFFDLVALNTVSSLIYKRAIVIHRAWSEGLEEVLSRLVLETDKYAEVFEEMGDKMLSAPTERDVSHMNYILKKGLPTYSVLEEKVDSLDLSFLSDSTFILEAVDKERMSQISFIYNNVPLHSVLASIQDRRLNKAYAQVSFLQGVDVSFIPRHPLSLFFSTKSVSEIKMVHRLLYYLYAAEYYLSRGKHHWRIRHVFLTLVSSIRMSVTEKVKEEAEVLRSVREIDRYNSSLEAALSNIMQASLLTSPQLLSFYSSILSSVFAYVEIRHRECLTQEEAGSIVEEYTAALTGAIPHVKSPFLLSIFEGLIGV